MNLIVSSPLWLLALLALAVAAAMVEDARHFRIPNLLSLAVAGGAVCAALLAGPSLALWQNAVVFAAILVLGTAAFTAGWLGGGDVKLFAALGLWFDLSAAVWFAALVLITGGMIAAIYLIRGLFGGGGLARSRARVPYGLAIGLGALAMIAFDSRILGHQQRSLPPLTIPHSRA